MQSIANGQFQCKELSFDDVGLRYTWKMDTFITPDDEAIVGDYDGDGLDEILKYTPSTGTFSVYDVVPGDSGKIEDMTFSSENFDLSALNDNAEDYIDKTILAGNLVFYPLESSPIDEVVVVDNSNHELNIFNFFGSENNWNANSVAALFFPEFASPSDSPDDESIEWGKVTLANILGGDLDQIVIQHHFDADHTFLAIQQLPNFSFWSFGPIEQDSGDLEATLQTLGQIISTHWERYSTSSNALQIDKIHTPIQVINSYSLPPFITDPPDYLAFFEVMESDFFDDDYTYINTGTVAIDKYIDKIINGCPERTVLPYALRSCEPVELYLDLDDSDGTTKERYEMISLTHCNGRNFVSREKTQKTRYVGDDKARDMANCSVFSHTAAIETMMGVRLKGHLPVTDDHSAVDFSPVDFSEGYYDFSSAKIVDSLGGTGYEWLDEDGTKKWHSDWLATTLGAYLPEPEQFKAWSSTDDPFRTAAMIRRFGISESNQDKTVRPRPFDKNCEDMDYNREINECIYSLAKHQEAIFISPYKPNGKMDNFVISTKCVDTSTGTTADCPDAEQKPADLSIQTLFNQIMKQWTKKSCTTCATVFQW